MTEAIFMYSGMPKLGPTLTDVAKKVTDLMKLEVVQGLAAEQQPNLFRASATRMTAGKPAPSVGAIVSQRLKSLPAEGKRGVRDFTKVPPLRLAATDEVRRLARTYNIDLAAEKPAVEQVDVQAFAFARQELFDTPTVAARHGDLYSIRAGGQISAAVALAEAEAPAARIDPTAMTLLRDRAAMAGPVTLAGIGAPAIVLNRGLKFRLHEVRCVDETNPEWPGSDEIAMGGVATDSKGATAKITEFMVGSGFDDGERKTYSPPRVVHNFSLDGLTYPADFLVTMALAEKDNGGLATFIQQLWDAIKNHVTAIITSLAAKLAVSVAGAGAAGGAIAGPLGSIIGAVAGAVLGALIGWLIQALQDDIFRPQAAAIRLPHPLSRFDNGSLTSPTLSVDFEDHGGLYRVFYSWELVR
ncbi:MAG: hypothetical protein LDL26_09110 [Caenispirillum bisanense]|nr:hypothetical protein [Caenispirillum bisanense]MCA1973835.1 hypothetical protein [Caenispirillum sp.]